MLRHNDKIVKIDYYSLLYISRSSFILVFYSSQLIL